MPGHLRLATTPRALRRLAASKAGAPLGSRGVVGGAPSASVPSTKGWSHCALFTGLVTSSTCTLHCGFLPVADLRCRLWSGVEYLSHL